MSIFEIVSNATSGLNEYVTPVTPTWTQSNLTTPVASLSAPILCDLGKTILVASGSKTLYSTTNGGVTWTTTANALPSTLTWSLGYRIPNTQTIIILPQTAGTGYTISVDNGTTWSAGTFTISASYRYFATGNNTTVLIPITGTSYLTSTNNGTSWITNTFPTTFSTLFKGLEYINGLFYYFHQNGTYYTSSTGLTGSWTLHPVIPWPFGTNPNTNTKFVSFITITYFKYINNSVIFTSNGCDGVLISSDLINWRLSLFPNQYTQANWKSPAFGNNTYIITQSGTIRTFLYSCDANVWYEGLFPTVPTSSNIAGVVYDSVNNKFIASINSTSSANSFTYYY